MTMRPPATHPPGLHVHLVAWGPSLCFALWVERYADPLGHRTLGRVREGESHPGCARTPPAWLGAKATRHTFHVRAPRLGNGVPVPLPGVVATWDLRRFQANGRVLATSWYEVSGWQVPTARSLAPLRELLLEWRRRFGDGYLAPQAARVIELLEGLQRRIAEGPLLPTLSRSSARSGRQGAEARVVWVPPVSLADVHRLMAPLRADPFLAEVVAADPYGRVTSCLNERYPTRFIRFLVDLLGAAAAAQCGRYRPEERSPWTTARLLEALRQGDESLIELHRAHGSCLHPHHPILQPPAVPPGHLHGRVSAAGAGAPAGQPFRLDLGLLDGDGWLPIAAMPGTAMIAGQAVHCQAVEHEGRTFMRPAQVLFRDLAIMAGEDTLFRRPELLGDGRCRLSAEEAERLLARTGRRATPWELDSFYDRELDIDDMSGRPRKGVSIFSAAAGGSAELRMRVRWDLLGAGGEATTLGDLGLVRFSPSSSLVLGDGELALEDAERLLRDSTAAILHVGEHLLHRAALEEAVEHLRARAKVLGRLGSGGGLSFPQVVALEDEWADELDANRQESLFTERWRQFLDGLTSGSGVPRLTTPAGFTGTLRPYQERGLSWLSFLSSHGMGACLADDMGLGKTIQVLALLCHNRRERGRTANLVICPTSVVTNWAREAARFAPTLAVYVHQGSARARDAALFQARAGESDLVVTSWALARRDGALLQSVDWAVIVADEAQNLKNPSAQQTRTVSNPPSGVNFDAIRRRQHATFATGTR